MILQENNRLHALKRRTLSVSPVQERSSVVIHFMQTQVKAIDKELLDLLESGEWAENARRLLSVKCVGVVTAGWLLVATFNFTTCESVDQLCSFAGLVPRQRQSGTSLQAYPHIGHAGHARLRQALFVATMTALQHNPVIKTYYQRLLARGKAPKPALIAASRKLLTICWACVKHGREFDAGYAERWR
jgi:transposase